MKTIREIFGSVLLACVFFSLNVYADAQCHGKFANPVTDYCWSCVFPISMGGNSVAGAERWTFAKRVLPSALVHKSTDVLDGSTTR